MRPIDADALRADYFVTSTTTNNPLYRYVSMEQIANAPTVEHVSPWHMVEELPRDCQECIVAYLGPTDWIYEHATYHSDLNKALEEDIFIEGTDGFIVDGDVGYARHSFNYWMPIEPPKEE